MKPIRTQMTNKIKLTSAEVRPWIRAAALHTVKDQDKLIKKELNCKQ